jgi:hypothetical protein
VSEDLRRPHFVTARREQWLARQPLRDYHVQWDDITHADVDRFEHTLDEVAPKAKKPELVVQAYLERHPLMLTAYLWGLDGGSFLKSASDPSTSQTSSSVKAALPGSNGSQWSWRVRARGCSTRRAIRQVR